MHKGEITRAIEDVLETLKKDRENGKTKIIDHVSHLGTETEIMALFLAVSHAIANKDMDVEEKKLYALIMSLLIGYKIAVNKFKTSS